MANDDHSRYMNMIRPGRNISYTESAVDDWGYKKPVDGYYISEWHRLELPASHHDKIVFSVLTGEVIEGFFWCRIFIHELNGKMRFEYASDDDMVELRLRGEA
jgi:hypothetical protein